MYTDRATIATTIVVATNMAVALHRAEMTEMTKDTTMIKDIHTSGTDHAHKRAHHPVDVHLLHVSMATSTALAATLAQMVSTAQMGTAATATSRFAVESNAISTGGRLLRESHHVDQEDNAVEMTGDLKAGRTSSPGALAQSLLMSARFYMRTTTVKVHQRG
jgi:hypothetical protein